MIEPAQRRKILLFVVLSFFCLGLPRVLTNTAAFTLFLQTFDSRWLPLTYIGAAVASPALGWVFIQLQRRLSFWALLQVALLTDLCIILALRAGLAQFDGEVGRALVMATAIWVEVEWMLAGLVFWGLSERMFTIREAKSLFGRIGAGEPAAVIAGGFAIPLFVALIGTADLLTVSAISMAASLLLLLLVRRRYGADLHEEEEEDEDTPVSFGRYRRYVYLAFAVAVMAETAHFFVDNAFYDRAETAFPDEGALASFIGFFFALSGAVTLVANVAVTGPVMRRFGLRTGLLLLPALLTLASAAVVGAAAAGLLGGIFVLVCIAKLIDEAVRSGVYNAAFLVVYQPLPPMLRTRAQAINESYFEQGAAGLGGLLLLGLTTYFAFGAVGILAVLIGILAVWIVLSLLLTRDYRGVLTLALSRGRVPVDDSVLAAPESLHAMRRALASSRPIEVVTALGFLERHDPGTVQAELADLLGHAEPDVRLEALRFAERHPEPDSTRAIAALLEREWEPRVRGMAQQARAASGGPEVLAALESVLDGPVEAERLGALIGLIRHRGRAGIAIAGPYLQSMVSAANPAERQLAARAIAEIASPSLQQPLLDLLDTPDDAVHRAALQAASHTSAPGLRPTLFAALSRGATAAPAAIALAAQGETLLPELIAAFQAPATPVRLRARLAAVAGRMAWAGTAAAGEFLFQHIAHAEPEVRRAVAAALRDAHIQAPMEHRTAVWGVLQETGASAAMAATWWQALDDDHAGLRKALADEVTRLQDQALLSLATLIPARAAEQARLRLASERSDYRAYAVELLDSLVPPQRRPLVSALLEPMDMPARARALQSQFRTTSLSAPDIRAALAGGETRWAIAWTRACALHAIGLRQDFNDRLIVAPWQNDPDDLICETARWAVRRIDPLIKQEEKAMLTIEKVMILRSVGIFAGVADPVLADVAEALTLREVPAGTTIIREGDPGQVMFVIVEGLVRVVQGGRDVALLQARDVFGELSVLDPETRSASVIAVEDTVLFELSHESVEDLMASNIDLARGFLRMLCRRVRSTTAQAA